jgi:hypothetical protein
LQTTVLGQIPIVMEIGEVSGKGTTIYSQPDKAIIESFDKISDQINELVKI